VRLGFGPFEDWEYMTSGMHAILAFSRMCETLDVNPKQHPSNIKPKTPNPKPQTQNPKLKTPNPKP